MLANHLIQMVSISVALNCLVVVFNEAAPTVEVAAAASGQQQFGARIAPVPKIKRDSKAKVTSMELDTEETGYLPHSGGYQKADNDYGYDAGKNTYGKQASDWSLYDQGKCWKVHYIKSSVYMSLLRLCDWSIMRMI